MRTTVQLKREAKTLHFWIDRFYHALWNSADAMKMDSEGDNKALNRNVRREIETKVYEIKKIIKDHYGPKIGEAVLREMEIY
jgi:hypothetical protein